MKKFIKLHNTNDNSVIVVSVNNILVVDTVVIDNKRFSRIYLDNNDMQEFDVNETPEKIFSMMN